MDYKFTYKFKDSTRIESAKLVPQLCSLAKDIFLIFGEQLTAQPKENIHKYEESAGWMSFPCTEIKNIFLQGDYCYTVVHNSMYNGHIGDTEEIVSAVFEATGKIINMYTNLYSSLPLLVVWLNELTKLETEKLKALLINKLKLVPCETL